MYREEEDPVGRRLPVVKRYSSRLTGVFGQIDDRETRDEEGPPADASYDAEQKVHYYGHESVLVETDGSGEK